MIIFLGNIAPETKKHEIASFINDFINKNILTYTSTSNANISIEDIATISVKDTNAHSLEKHGLVIIPQKELGEKIIKKLDGTTFNQKLITCREYIYRSAQNDPRNINPNTKIDFKDRRISDRRRKPSMDFWRIDPFYATV